jgi:hypothetical protein
MEPLTHQKLLTKLNWPQDACGFKAVWDLTDQEIESIPPEAWLEWAKGRLEIANVNPDALGMKASALQDLEGLQKAKSVHGYVKQKVKAIRELLERYFQDTATLRKWEEAKEIEWAGGTPCPTELDQAAKAIVLKCLKNFNPRDNYPSSLIVKELINGKVETLRFNLQSYQTGLYVSVSDGTHDNQAAYKATPFLRGFKRDISKALERGACLQLGYLKNLLTV